MHNVCIGVMEYNYINWNAYTSKNTELKSLYRIHFQLLLIVKINQQSTLQHS